MIALEDNFEDVLMKAATGLGFGKLVLAECAGLSVEAVDALLQGNLDECALRAVSRVLHLDAEALLAMAMDRGQPQPLKMEGMVCFNSPFPVPGYPEMTVNSYLFWSLDTREAVVFDTGTNIDALLETVESRNLNVQRLFLTHVHRDHVAAYDSIIESFPGLVCYAPDGEPYKQALPVSHGDIFSFGCLQVEARSTPGHSPGGTSYVLHGLARPVGIVGDALFCRSQGGVSQAHYTSALEVNRRQILSLPKETILCPGHGPMTTVGWELSGNPFYAGK